MLIRDLQLLELEIAKEIKRVCDNNNIDYFIIGGTLLGAVRHKGFIPWDDDMDIGMTIENYNKFLAIAPSGLADQFFLQSVESDPFFFNPYAKVRMNGTHMFEKVSEHLDIHNGIFVDIFPYDLADESTAKSKLHMLKLQLLGKMSLLKHDYNLNEITENKFSKLVNTMLKYLPVSVGTVDSRLLKSFSHHGGNKEQSYYIERDGMFRGNFVFPISYFSELVELPFEDTTFKAPGQFDLYLKQAYGSYMEFPPEKEREKGHSVNGIELENVYESYFRL